jgi:hypothetical protein
MQIHEIFFAAETQNSGFAVQSSKWLYGCSTMVQQLFNDCSKFKVQSGSEFFNPAAGQSGRRHIPSN